MPNSLSLKDAVAVAKKLARKNGGLLPNSHWLVQNKYSSVYKFLRLHPKAFSHIKQKKGNNTLQQNVKLAEKLARKNGGVLPHGGWLATNGYKKIEHALRLHPKAFSHIKQKKGKNTLQQNVKLAEKLARKNGGVLPHGTWLRENKYDRITSAIKGYPKSFAHIEKDMGGSPFTCLTRIHPKRAEFFMSGVAFRPQWNFLRGEVAG